MDNLISRQAAIDALEEERKYLLARGQYGAEDVLVHHALNVIDELPSAEPERKKGEWVPNIMDFFGMKATIGMKCSVCGEDALVADGGDEVLSNFCPNCGADMRGEEDE